MKNVLIVSDFSGSLDYYKRLVDFKAHGFRVVGQVKTRSDLSEQLNKVKIDLFIVQEGFSGLEYDVIDDVLRKNNEDAEIIVVSTNESPIRERKAMSKGAFAYLRRPLAAATFDIIIDSVDKRIERNKKYSEKKEEQSEKESTKKKYKNFVLNNIISNEKAIKGEEDRIRDAGIILDGDTLCMIIARGNECEEIADFIKKNLEKKCDVETFCKNKDAIGILADDKQAVIDNVKEVAKKVASEFDDVKIAISSTYSKLYESAAIYNSTLYNIEQTSGEEYNAFIREDATENVISEIQRIIKSGENVEKEVISALDTKTNGLSPEENAYVAINVILNCDGTLKKTWSKRAEFFKDISSKVNLQETIDRIALLAEETAKTKQREKVPSTVVVAEGCYEYLLKNHGKPDLAVKTVAEKFRVSQNYLTTLMKKYYGDTFINILTKVRMEKARELLLYSRKKVGEICTEVGYTNSHYFSYTFKKYYGVSPLEMREMGERQ
ncbi:MAG: helix-turn-helix domain-containing protein [Clostridia bacterium]|nr:helix-turn-helix domain-containing protein [Clostridia bacterium]MBR2874595.1 helix-turn-helix domain-containing protein [Clostridia bacterium]